jgi:hypothetical protein
MPGAALGLSNAGVTSAFSSCPRLPPSRRPSRSPSPGSCPAISASRVDATRRSGPEPLALDSNCDDRCRSSESVAARGREQARAILGPACDGMQAMVQFGCLARRERPSPAPSHITCQVYPPIPRLDLAAHMEHPSRRRERHRAPAFPNWSVASTARGAMGSGRTARRSSRDRACGRGIRTRFSHSLDRHRGWCDTIGHCSVRLLFPDIRSSGRSKGRSERGDQRSCGHRRRAMPDADVGAGSGRGARHQLNPNYSGRFLPESS